MRLDTRDPVGVTLAERRAKYTPMAVPPSVGFKCTEESKTKQSFKDECDINNIVRMFGVTGKLPTPVRMPTYGDFTEVGDFRDAMEAIRLANEAFSDMPAAVRDRFNNDPAKFVDFCSDEKNRPEAEKMGLVMPKVVNGVPEKALDKEDVAEKK